MQPLHDPYDPDIEEHLTPLAVCRICGWPLAPDPALACPLCAEEDPHTASPQ